MDARVKDLRMGFRKDGGPAAALTLETQDVEGALAAFGARFVRVEALQEDLPGARRRKPKAEPGPPAEPTT